MNKVLLIGIVIVAVVVVAAAAYLVIDGSEDPKDLDFEKLNEGAVFEYKLEGKEVDPDDAEKFNKISGTVTWTLASMTDTEYTFDVVTKMSGEDAVDTTKKVLKTEFMSLPDGATVGADEKIDTKWGKDFNVSTAVSGDEKYFYTDAPGAGSIIYKVETPVADLDKDKAHEIWSLVEAKDGKAPKE